MVNNLLVMRFHCFYTHSISDVLAASVKLGVKHDLIQIKYVLLHAEINLIWWHVNGSNRKNMDLGCTAVRGMKAKDMFLFFFFLWQEGAKGVLQLGRERVEFKTVNLAFHLLGLWGLHSIISGNTTKSQRKGSSLASNYEHCTLDLQPKPVLCWSRV